LEVILFSHTINTLELMKGGVLDTTPFFPCVFLQAYDMKELNFHGMDTPQINLWGFDILSVDYQLNRC
jgi:hypothetical protein